MQATEALQYHYRGRAQEIICAQDSISGMGAYLDNLGNQFPIASRGLGLPRG